MSDVGADLALETVVRAESGRLVGLLHRSLGDLDVAEEAVAEAVAEALGAWRRDGIPDRPAAWLHTAARRNALDRLRREARLRERLPSLGEWAAGRAAAAGRAGGRAAAVAAGDDERLALLFGCCHPALAPPSRLVLTLRAVLGLTTAEIARATFEPEATVAQRISRAKRKIGAAAIPLRVPEVAELPERLDVVLTVVATAYNEAYLATGGPDPTRRDLAEDATWLAGVIATALPDEPEALGLLVLLRLHQARADARFDADGHLVLLADQDRSLWRHDEVASADRRCWSGRRRCVVRAATSCRPRSPPATARRDLGRHRLAADPDPLRPAAALRPVAGGAAQPGGRDGAGRGSGRSRSPRWTPWPQPLRRFHLLHATRAQLLRDLDRPDEARAADRLALAATGNVAERALPGLAAAAPARPAACTAASAPAASRRAPLQ